MKKEDRASLIRLLGIHFLFILVWELAVLITYFLAWLAVGDSDRGDPTVGTIVLAAVFPIFAVAAFIGRWIGYHTKEKYFLFTVPALWVAFFIGVVAMGFFVNSMGPP